MAESINKNLSSKKGLSPKSQEDTKTLLLVAAKKIFAKKGYDGTSIKDLVTEAGGVNVSSISYHFGGKEGLYRACLENFGNAKLSMASKLLQSPKSLDELRFKLRLFSEEMIEGYIEDPDLTTILHRDAEMENLLTEDIFRKTFLRVFEMLFNFLKAAQKAKIINSSLNPQSMAKLFFGMLLHLTRTDLLNKKYFGVGLESVKYRQEMIDHILTIFLSGVLRNNELTTATTNFND